MKTTVASLIRSADVLTNDLHEISTDDREFAERHLNPRDYLHSASYEMMKYRQDEVKDKLRWNQLLLLLLEWRWLPYAPASVRSYRDRKRREWASVFIRWSSPVFVSKVVLLLSMLLGLLGIAFLKEDTLYSHYPVLGTVVSGLGAFIGVMIWFLGSYYRDVVYPVWVQQKLSEFSWSGLDEDTQQLIDRVGEQFPEVTFCLSVLWDERAGLCSWPILSLQVPFGDKVTVYYLKAWDYEYGPLFPKKSWVGLFREGESVCV